MAFFIKAFLGIFERLSLSRNGGRSCFLDHSLYCSLNNSDCGIVVWIVLWAGLCCCVIRWIFLRSSLGFWVILLDSLDRRGCL